MDEQRIRLNCRRYVQAVQRAFHGRGRVLFASKAAAFKREYVERSYFDDEDIRIVRKKQFDLKPMYPEDACVQMELLGHNFFVFINAETEQIAVVYKRKGSTYGMIEPEG